MIEVISIHKRYLPHLENHFSTIGVNGINEMIMNFTDNADNITTESELNLFQKC